MSYCGNASCKPYWLDDRRADLIRRAGNPDDKAAIFDLRQEIPEIILDKPLAVWGRTWDSAGKTFDGQHPSVYLALCRLLDWFDARAEAGLHLKHNPCGFRKFLLTHLVRFTSDEENQHNNPAPTRITLVELDPDHHPPAPDRGFVQIPDRQFVIPYLKELKPVDQQIVILRHVFDLQFDEIAERLDIESVDTVKTKYYRAMEKLGEMMRRNQ